MHNIELGIFLIVILLLVCYVMNKRDERLRDGLPNINYNSGVGTNVQGFLFGQPQQTGSTGYEPDDIQRDIPLEEDQADLATDDADFLKRKYDDGANVFTIRNSISPISDTTEDNLFNYTMERSRYSNGDMTV